MKKLATVLLAAACLTASLNADVVFSGISLRNATNLTAGQNAAYVVGIPSGFLDTGPIGPGDNLGGLIGIGTDTSHILFAATILPSSFSFDQTPFVGQQFSVIVFDSSPLGLSAPGDTYSVWSAPSWVVPAIDGLYEFDSDFAQLSSAPSATGTVVPEPSTYAAIAGLLSLGAVILRKRLR